MGLGVSPAQVSVIAVPLSLIWLALALWLARTHDRKEASLWSKSIDNATLRIARFFSRR
jgi:hypothetical protein